jgi:hypothetical protein
VSAFWKGALGAATFLVVFMFGAFVGFHVGEIYGAGRVMAALLSDQQQPSAGNGADMEPQTDLHVSD